MNKSKKLLWLIPGIILAVVAVGGIVMFFVNKSRTARAEAKFEEIAQESAAVPEPVEEPAEAEPEEPAEEEPAEEESLSLKEMLEIEEEKPDPLEGIEIPEKEIDWDALHEENEDIYAWITVTGTKIDYPIVQDEEDNEYYLNHNLDGSRGYPGCIYTENYNSKYFDDPNTVIYGHNMLDGSMFASLHKFDDGSLLEEDQYIYIYTEDAIFVYRVFGAYEFSSMHLLLCYDLSNEYEFEQYLKDIAGVSKENQRIANFVKDIELTKEDRLVTLSTCTPDSRNDLRFLVQGVLLGKKDAGEE